MGRLLRRISQRFFTSDGGGSRWKVVVPGIGAISLRPGGGRADAWLDDLDGEHRRLFQVCQPRDGLPLVSVLNFMDTYNQIFGIPDAALGAVVVLFRRAIGFALDDATWAEFDLGRHFGVADGQRPATRNLWRASLDTRGGPAPGAAIEALQRRGARFVACQVSLATLAGRLASARGENARAVFARLRDGLLAGVILVPCARSAIEAACRRGIESRDLGVDSPSGAHPTLRRRTA